MSQIGPSFQPFNPFDATKVSVETTSDQLISLPLTDEGDVLDTTTKKEIAGLLVGLLQPLDPLNAVESTQGASPRIDEKISTLVSEILPSYISDDYPTFVLFLKSFYEYLELEGGTRFTAVKLNTYRDIDQTLDTFIDHMMSEFAAGFPDQIESGMSKRQILKLISKYYEDKGASVSAELIFRILYNKEADVSFPREKLFELSQGESDDVSTMRITRTSGITAMASIEGGIIRQRPVNVYGQVYSTVEAEAQAFIDKVTMTKTDNLEHALLTIKNVSGTFIANRTVELVKGSTLLSEVTHNSIYGITVENKGINFVVGQSIVVKDADENVVATSSISGTGVSGDITNIAPITTSALYLPYKNYSISIDSNGSGATLSLITGIANSTVRKVRRTDRSTLSSTSVIQDNFRNQQHSYVISVEEQLSKFKDIIVEIFHPAGSRLFSDHNVIRSFSATTFDVETPNQSVTAENPVRYRPAIGHFTPYIFSGTFDLRGDTYTPALSGSPTYIDYYPTGFNGLTMATIGTSATHDPITSGFTIGAMGGPSAGTQNPEAYGLTFSVNAGVTLPGYTVENINQFVQVSGTDSITAPFWIVYKHPKNSAIGFKKTFSEKRKTFFIDTEGPLGVGKSLGYFNSYTGGISTGDILVQRSSDRRTAIGEVVRGQVEDSTTISISSFRSKLLPRGITAAFSVTINTINGDFTNIGNQDGSERYIENLRTGVTYEAAGTGGIQFIVGATANTGVLDWNHTLIEDFLDKTVYD